MSYSFNIGFEPGLAREVQAFVEELGGNVSPSWKITSNAIWCTVMHITHEDLIMLKLRFKILGMYQLLGLDNNE